MSRKAGVYRFSAETLRGGQRGLSSLPRLFWGDLGRLLTEAANRDRLGKSFELVVWFPIPSCCPEALCQRADRFLAKRAGRSPKQMFRCTSSSSNSRRKKLAGEVRMAEPNSHSALHRLPRPSSILNPRKWVLDFSLRGSMRRDKC